MTPSKDILVIMGDFSAKVGKDWESWNGTLGKFRLYESNNRGETAELQLVYYKNFLQAEKDCK